MAKTGMAGVVKRYGVRYGKRVKDKVDKIFFVRALDDKCPYCLKSGVRRIASGIWYCRHCSSKFTGGAYSVGKLRISEKPREEAGEAAGKTEGEREKAEA